jgi:cyclophilin family peptidyl-prolyl cis-trans isomerase/protein-disulfide isomerase
MKRISKVVLFLLVAALALSACKVVTITPPEVEPTATVEVTEPTTEVVVEPTEDLGPQPTADTRLTGDDGKMVCTMAQPFFPVLTEEQKQELSIYPEVSEQDWVKGAENPILTIVEYTEFQCPYCQLFAYEAEKLMDAYPDDVQLVYRPLPLDSLHPNARQAAYAVEAAGAQGKFWDLYLLLFNKKDEFSAITSEEFTDWLIVEAEGLGIDKDQFAADLASDTLRAKVDEEVAYNFSVGLNSTPTLLLNGIPWPYDWSYAMLSNVIKVLKAEESFIGECPPFVIDVDKTYTATITTENGDMTIELYPEAAPLAVNSFVYLAQKGFYDGVTFHRVMHDFMAQTGDPTGTGMSGAGYQYREEIVGNLTFDEPYMVGVARTQESGTSGSQFFITYMPYPSLNGLYTIFGKLVDGVDIFEKITERDPQQAPDFDGDEIISITITEK